MRQWESADWTAPRSGKYRFMRVDFETRKEIGEVETIKSGGTISRNINTSLKESGMLEAAEGFNIGDDLVRIYYRAETAEASTEFPLATMHAVGASSVASSAARTSSLTLFSALLTAQQSCIESSLTITAGTPAVEYAASLLEDLGLPVISDESSRELGADASWDAGTPYLEIVNYLLSVAGFWSARTDTWGRVLLSVYQDPASRAVTHSFYPGPDSVLIPSIGMESDSFDIPNVCIMTSSSATEEALVAVAENDDPASPFSTVRRGRRITMSATVEDVSDIEELRAKAKARLQAASTPSEMFDINHPLITITIGDVVGLSWPEHGLEVKGPVQSQEIELTPAGRTVSTIRRLS